MNTEQRPESELLWLFGPYSQLLEDREQHGRGRRCWVPGKQNQKRFHIQDSKSKLIIGMGEARAGPGPCELRPNSELLGKPQWPKGWRICLQCRRPRFDPWVEKIPWRRKWQPTPVFLPGKSHGQRRLTGYSPWGHKESDTTERAQVHTYIRVVRLKRLNSWGASTVSPLYTNQFSSESSFLSPIFS